MPPAIHSGLAVNISIVKPAWSITITATTVQNWEDGLTETRFKKKAGGIYMQWLKIE